MSMVNISFNDDNATTVTDQTRATGDISIFITRLASELTTLKTHVTSLPPANSTKGIETNYTRDAYAFEQINHTIGDFYQLLGLWTNITDALRCLENIVRAVNRHKMVLMSQLFGSLNNSKPIAPETDFGTSSPKTEDIDVIRQLKDSSLVSYECHDWSFNTLSSDDYEWIEIAEKLLSSLNDSTRLNEATRGTWQTTEVSESLTAVRGFVTYVSIPIISTAASILDEMKWNQATNHAASDQFRESASKFTSSGYPTSHPRLTSHVSHVMPVHTKSTQHPPIHLSHHPHATGKWCECCIFHAVDLQLWLQKNV